MQTWQIGDVRITKIPEIEMAGPATWIVPDATAEALKAEPWLRPHFADAEGVSTMSVHALVIESEARRIVVDTCVGNDKQRPIPGWSDRDGPFLQDLADAGFSTDSIDTVLCTHLHVDHVGWNTRLENGRWVPTFPKARYLFNEKEYRHWESDEEQPYGDVFGDSVKPIFDAGLVDMVTPDHVLTSEVHLESTPGHTPGHVSVKISSKGAEAVITGDLMHHPVQCAHPEWGSSADVDPGQALATRRDFLERYADSPVLVLGTHFATPTGGRITRKGDAYRFEV